MVTVSGMESVTLAQASVNDGPFFPAELVKGSDVQMVRSETAVIADPGWEHADSHGHFHAFAEGGKTPTLTKWFEHVPCDGSCGGVCEGEGYDAARWKCVICGDPVEPRFVPDRDARHQGIPVVNRIWSIVTIRGEGPLPGTAPDASGVVTLTVTPVKVTVRVRAGDGEMLGIGYLRKTAAIYRRGVAEWEVTIDAGPLLPRPAQILAPAG